MKLSIGRRVWRGILLAGVVIPTIYFAWTCFKSNSDETSVTLTGEELEYLLSTLEVDQEDPPFAWVTVSPETTYITEPLDSYGRVDYLAAYNNFASKGVTPENNASVRFVKAGHGLFEFSEEERLVFFKLLGIEPLLETEHYFSPFQSSDDQEQSEFDRAQTEPWSPIEFPQFESWLEENQSPLELVVEGTQCPFSYTPLFPSHGSKLLMNAPLPVAQLARDYSRTLALRAMRHLNEGRISEAQQDLLACHRLGRLIGTNHSLMVAIVCFDIDRRACAGDAALMSSGNLDPKSVLAYREELRQLPPMPDIFAEIDYFQRLMMLDSASEWKMKRHAIFLENTEDLTPEQIARLKEMFDALLRTCNEGFDRIAAAGHLPTYWERVQQIAKETNQLQEYLAPIKGVKDKTDPRMIRFAAKKMRELKGATPTAVGQEMGTFFYSLTLPMVPLVADAKAQTRATLVDVGLTLVAFRGKHGEYPITLHQLVPDVFAALPTDHFGSTFLQYRSLPDGFRLYSCGPNGMDDSGRTETSNPPADDLVLEVRHLKQHTR